MMGWLQAVVLGIVQGLTEFLPVSSSGHLVLFHHLFGLTEPQLFFDVSVHLGTLGAVLIVFWRDLQAMIVSVGRSFGTLLAGREGLARITADPDARLVFLIGVASIPTAALGLFFNSMADRIFSSLLLVGLLLLVTGSMLWGTRFVTKSGWSLAGFPVWVALAIGVIQGMAVLPGVSRAGATISVALFLGLSREAAGRFSFLLFIPAVVGAQVLSLQAAMSAPALPLREALVGTAVAFGVGYIALKFLLGVVKRGQLHYFAPYCWLVGLVIVGWWGWKGGF